MKKKPRNPLVSKVLFRKAGVHQKTTKSTRRREHVLLTKMKRDYSQG
ncbi:MAG: hypothetical protein PHC51_12600 [bacterium]|nr:hypothetical protein [bacterium]